MKCEGEAFVIFSSGASQGLYHVKLEYWLQCFGFVHRSSETTIVSGCLFEDIKSMRRQRAGIERRQDLAKRSGRGRVSVRILKEKFWRNGFQCGHSARFGPVQCGVSEDIVCGGYAYGELDSLQ